MLKRSQVLETMDPNGNNVYTSIILDKYEKCPDNLEPVCLTDFASIYDYAGKSEEEQQGTAYIKSYTISVTC